MNITHAPMGWNSWDCYGTAVTEEQVRSNADYVATHLKKYGWEYIVIDGQWYEPSAEGHSYHDFAFLCMDEYSRLIPTTNRFPSAKDGKGFGPLAEYIHSLGLKFGIRIMRGIPRQAVHQNTALKGTTRRAQEIVRGSNPCEWCTDMYTVSPYTQGSREYYSSLFELYASWGVDYIKLDDTGNILDQTETEFLLIQECLRNCGREMLLSISPGPVPIAYAEELKQLANMWRITNNFWDRWDFLYDTFADVAKWASHTCAGHWPDADLLPIGPILQDYDIDNYTAFTQNEQRTVLSLWSIFRSPLMIGGDTTKFDDFTLRLITNQGILAMHRNARHSHQAWRREIDEREHILWEASSIDGGTYLALFNVSEEASHFTLDLTALELPDFETIENLWEETTVTPSSNNTIEIALHKHEPVVFYIH